MRMQMTRRDYLSALGIGLIATIQPRTAAALFASRKTDQTPALRDVAAAAGLQYGSDSDVWFRNATTMLYVNKKPVEKIEITPAAWRDLVSRNCSLYAPILSWEEVAPDPTHEDDHRDENVATVLAAGLRLTGAHLLWYLRTPPWLEKMSRQQAQQATAGHIQRLVSAYRGQVFSWNVVNEAIEPEQNGPDGLRVDSPLVRALGYDFFQTAFQQARAADPKALLLYNEYDLELDTPDQEARRKSLFLLLDKLQKVDAPIDGVGLQSHLKLSHFGHFNETLYRNFLHELASRNLKIVISELDVDDRGAPPDITIRDRQVADVYSRFLSVALDEPAVKALVTWGLCDAYSWYNGRYFSRFARADGLPQRPLLFDLELQPKPAFYAVLAALQHAPKRPAISKSLNLH
jgi:endo-1,4-beta-xylanase